MSESWEYGEDRELTPAPGFPWPPPEDGPITTAFAATWKGATFDPSGFFAEGPRDDGTGPAIIYYLAVGILVAAATLFWDSMAFLAGPAPGSSLAADLGFGNVSPLVRFLLSPVLLLLALGVSTAVVHVLLLIFDGADHGFGTTVRVFCYSYSPAIFGVVPVLGALVGGIWSVVLVIIGLREAHEAAAWKPVVAVLLPFLGAMIVFLLLTFSLLMAVGGGLPGG